MSSCSGELACSSAGRRRRVGSPRKRSWSGRRSRRASAMCSSPGARRSRTATCSPNRQRCGRSRRPSTVSENAIKQHLVSLAEKFGIEGAERRRSRLANAALDAGVVTLADIQSGRCKQTSPHRRSVRADRDARARRRSDGSQGRRYPSRTPRHAGRSVAARPGETPEAMLVEAPRVALASAPSWGRPRARRPLR